MAKASILKKVMNANVFSLLVIAKFAGLFLWGVLGFSEMDYFGQYSLCLGLVNVFYVVAGMRGRIFVLQSIKSLGDYRNFVLLMFIFGIIGTILIAFLNSGSDLFGLIILVAVSKFAGMFLLSNASSVQNQYSRDMSFSGLNRHGWLVVIGFFAFLPFGLHYAIGAEVVVLIYTLTRQGFLIQRGNYEEHQERGIKAILFNGMEFTATAGLNAALVSFFIYYVSSQFAQEDVYLIAKIFSVQAVAVRIISGNNIYFMREIDDKLNGILFRLMLSAFVVWAFVSIFVFMQLDNWDHMTLLLIIGAGYSLMNCASTMIIQHVLLKHGPRRIGYLHAVELSILLLVCLNVAMSAVVAMYVFGCLRLLRTIAMSQRWFLTDVGVRRSKDIL